MPVFLSSEVKFTDNSASGLSIMPASCPSRAHWDKECNAPQSPNCAISVSPSTITAGQTNTVRVTWATGAPTAVISQDSLVAEIRGSITGIGAVFSSGTLDIAAPSGSFDFTYSGGYFDALGQQLDTFRCTARLTVNGAPQTSLYINQVQLYRAPGSTVYPGDRISYRMYVQARGDQNWLTIRDRIPAYTTLIWQGGGTDNGNSCSQIPGCVDGNGDVWWAQQYAPSGWSGYVDFTVQVANTVPNGSQICNTGRAESQEVSTKYSNEICNPVAVCMTPLEAARLNAQGYEAGAYQAGGKQINKNTVPICVSNTSGSSYFVPANTQAEIESFKANLPPGASYVPIQ